ncbi:hypothetical protein KXD40_007326 [Peronospora effusa]|nr:hypothetical protein KXD40_007326 [Peronospora effusa]
MFGESKTVEMIATVNEKSSVAERVKPMLYAQFRLWIKDGIPSDTLKDKLSDDGVSEDVVKKITDGIINYWSLPKEERAKY